MDPYKRDDWYWSNYRKSMDWIKRHEVAYWKSQALSYKSENQQLLNTIQGLSGVSLPQRSQPNHPRKHRRRKRHMKCHKPGLSHPEPEMEVTDELMNFLKISMNHKKKLQHEKELQKSLLSAFLPPQDVLEARQKEMRELYGDGSSKILGMETAMSLAFDRFVDQKNPKPWSSLQ